MPKQILNSILLVLMEGVSREKNTLLAMHIKALQQHYKLEVISRSKLTEESLLEKLKQSQPDLLLLPLDQYQSWNKIDAFFGLNRTQGSTLACYLIEPTSIEKLEEYQLSGRRMIIDFYYLKPPEILILMKSLIPDTHRAGIKVFLEQNSPIYCESWYGGQGQGTRMDSILSLPEIAQTPWNKRSSAIRIILSAFWGLIYEEGPGRTDLLQGGNVTVTKGYFQVGASSACLIFRLYYNNPALLSPKDVLKLFWPSLSASTKSAQLLLKYSDFVRVHQFPETSDIELVVGLFPSAPSENGMYELRTLWIEPLTARLLSEPPYAAPSPQAPQLRALPFIATPFLKPRLLENGDSDPALADAHDKIRELKEKIREREEKIEELKSGGVDHAASSSHRDIEEILEEFQRKYFDAKNQIHQFDLKLQHLQKKGGSPQEIEELRLKMDALANREKAWIKKLFLTIESFKKTKKNG